MLGRKPPAEPTEAEDHRGFDAYDLKLGDVMRGERATLGKSLLDVQRELKIKANYIAAIENADPSIFETPGFIAGYVRSYARYLGMDPEWTYERFCQESGFAGIEGHTLDNSASKSKPSKLRAPADDQLASPFAQFGAAGPSLLSRIEPGAIGSIAILFGLIAVLGYGGLAVLREIQRVDFAPVDQAPGVVAQIESPSGDDLTDGQLTAEVNPGLSAPTADALDRLYRPQALETPVFTARDGPIASLDPRNTGTLVYQPAPPAREPEPEIVVARDPIDTEPVLTPVQVVEPVGPDVVLFAVRPAWIRVAAIDGTILFEKTLNKGERYVLPQTDEPPLLRAGNSGSLYFTVQGRAYGPAGPGTSVAKNVPLGVEVITQNYAQADLEADPDLPEVLTAMAASPLPVEEELTAEQ